MKKKTSTLTLFISSLGILISNISADAVDVTPGLGIAPPPGRKGLWIDQDFIWIGEKYQFGNSLNLGTEVEIQSIGFQYAQSFNLNSKPAAFYLNSKRARALPSGSLAEQSTVYGLTDTVAALVYWPFADRTEGRYLGIGGFLIAPTGDYDSNRLINLGANRFSFAVQTVYHHNLSESWHIMLSSDVKLHGKNSDYRLTHQTFEQQPLYSIQGTVMHHLNPGLTLSGSYFYHLGGESKLDGDLQQDKISRGRFELGVIRKAGPGSLYLLYGEDFSTENGFIQDKRISIRYRLPLK